MCLSYIYTTIIGTFTNIRVNATKLQTRNIAIICFKSGNIKNLQGIHEQLQKQRRQWAYFVPSRSLLFSLDNKYVEWGSDGREDSISSNIPRGCPHSTNQDRTSYRRNKLFLLKYSSQSGKNCRNLAASSRRRALRLWGRSAAFCMCLSVWKPQLTHHKQG